MADVLAALTPRRRLLLRAAWEGRVYADESGRYWLDRTSPITAEFKPLVQLGLTKPRSFSAAEPVKQRIVWFSYDAQAALARGSS